MTLQHCFIWYLGAKHPWLTASHYIHNLARLNLLTYMHSYTVKYRLNRRHIQYILSNICGHETHFNSVCVKMSYALTQCFPQGVDKIAGLNTCFGVWEANLLQKCRFCIRIWTKSLQFGGMICNIWLNSVHYCSEYFDIKFRNTDVSRNWYLWHACVITENTGRWFYLSVSFVPEFVAHIRIHTYIISMA